MATPLNPADPVQAAFLAKGVQDVETMTSIIGGVVDILAAFAGTGLPAQQFAAVAASQVKTAADARTAQANQLSAQIATLQSQFAALTS